LLRACASHFQPGGSVCEPAHCLTYAGPLQFQGEYRLLAILARFNLGSGQISQGRVCSLPIGEGAGWSSTHSSRWGIGFGEMQHSLKACPHLCERRTARPRSSFGLFQRAYPGPPFGGCQGNVRFPSPPTPLPPPRTTPIFPRRPISGKCGSPQAGLSDASLPVAKSQGTSPHRPAPSAIKAGVSEALQPLRLPGKLRSCSTCWFNAFLLADGRWGGRAVHRHDEQIMHTPFVQSRGYWMASEAKGKPGHQPIGFRCGWASSLQTSEHLLVKSNKGVSCAGAPAQEHTMRAWKVPWSVQHRGITHIY
jgi:hypothetical protein